MRATLVRDRLERCAYLDKHGGTPFPQALGLTYSRLQAYFDTEVHQQAVKAAEGEGKLAMAQINRLDGVIKAIGHLGKALARR